MVVDNASESKENEKALQGKIDACRLPNWREVVRKIK